jgi:hypothetical protein
MSATTMEGRPTSNQTALNTTPTIFSRRIGATIESQLDDALWKLLAGNIELRDLTDALQAWWLVAYDTGRAANPDLARITWERDYWHFRFCNPSVDYYRDTTDRLWQEAAA